MDQSVAAKWDADLEEIFQKQASDVWCQPTPDIDSNLSFNFNQDGMMNFDLNANQMTNSFDAPQLIGGGYQHTQPNTITMSDFLSSQQQHQQHQNAPAYYNPQQTFAHTQLAQSGALQYPGPPVYKPVNSKNCKIEAPIDANSLIHYPEMEKYVQKAPLHLQSATNRFRFRFHAILHCATTYCKEEHDPVHETYLNKCQCYDITIRDTMPQRRHGSQRFRTYVRISFENANQREKPAPYWALWRDGRGTTEASQRGGRVVAVEFVTKAKAIQSVTNSTIRPAQLHLNANVQVVSEAFDGFAVEWTPDEYGGCSIQLKFNFLATDFSPSKGVKGVPLRLCLKTEVIDPPPSMGPPGITREISYCRVKTFRDHGAERKITNDMQGIQKKIEHYTQAIQQAHSNSNKNGKRRASQSLNQRPAKMAKHKRASSIVSTTSSNGGEDDLHAHLRFYQNALQGKQAIALFHLQGEDLDDPDLYPVDLSGIPSSRIENLDSPEIKPLKRRTTQQSEQTEESMASPASSSSEFGSPSRSSTGLTSLHGPASMNLPPAAPQLDMKVVHAAQVGTDSTNPQELISPPQEFMTSKSAAGNEWVDTTSIDQSYEPPTPQSAKPVACFYIMQKSHGSSSVGGGGGGAMYRAIYVRRRTLPEFVAAIARKYDVDANAITTTIRINNRGLPIELDDEAISEMPEGQDMITELGYIDHSPFRKLTLRY